MGSSPGKPCCKEATNDKIEKVEEFDFFFSHKQSEAADAASNIINHLKLMRPAIKVWLDVEQNPTEEGMRSGVEASSAFIFYCTENIGFSKYCIMELTWAVEMQKKIILVAETDARHGATEIGVLRDRMPDELKHVFDTNVAIPYYRDPAHRDVCIQKLLDHLDGKIFSQPHGSMERQASASATSEAVLVAAASSGFKDAHQAVTNATEKLKRLMKNKKPTLIICNATCNYDCEIVQKELKKTCSSSQTFLGCTSSAGVMVDQTWHSQENFGFGLFGIYDPEGCYIVGHAKDVKDVRAVCEATLKKSNQTTAPDFVFTFPHPGCEEMVLEELAAGLGGSVPVIGGSSADNSLAGEWKQFSSDGVSGAGFVFALCWPSVLVHAGFASGFQPTENVGKLTKMHDKRHIATIDGEKAALVYDRWSGGRFSEAMKEKEDSNVLAQSTFTPLGIQYGNDLDGEPMYVVIHPHLIKKNDMSVTTFKDLPEGGTIVCLGGTRQNLVTRLSKVVTSIVNSAPFTINDVIGSYQIFCGGVMMAIKEDMPTVAEKLGIVLNWTPSMGACTFGEQGTFLDGEPGHGNLMFASLVFSRIKKVNTRRHSFNRAPRVLKPQT